MADEMLSLGKPVKSSVKPKMRKQGVRHLYDEVMAIVQDNGQVTLPSSASAPFLAKRRRQSALVLAGILIFVLRFFIAKRR